MVLHPICCMHPRAHRPKPLERRQLLSSQKHMTRTWKFMTKTFELISNDIFWLSSTYRAPQYIQKVTCSGEVNSTKYLSCLLHFNFICFNNIITFLARSVFKTKFLQSTLQQTFLGLSYSCKWCITSETSIKKSLINSSQPFKESRNKIFWKRLHKFDETSSDFSNLLELPEPYQWLRGVFRILIWWVLSVNKIFI